MRLRRVSILAVISMIVLGVLWLAIFSEKLSGAEIPEIVKSRQSLQPLVTYRDKFYDASAVKNDAWIIGYYGTILHMKENPPCWEKQNSQTTLPLFGVSFADEKNGLVVGKKGIILRTTNGGQAWEKVCEGDKNLYSVRLVDAMQGWAVGEFCTILHTSDGGKTWQDQSIKGKDVILNKCFFINESIGWVVGEFATILYTQDGGTSWQIQHEDYKGVTLFDVSFKNSTEGIAVGQNGTFFQTRDSGRTWEQVKLSSEDNLLGIGILEGKFWIVGLRGTILEEDPTKGFTPGKSLPVPDWLQCIFTLPTGLGIIAGDHGRILYSYNYSERYWDRLH